MKYLEFMFQSFWHFSGSIIAIDCVLSGTAAIISELFNKSNNNNHEKRN